MSRPVNIDLTKPLEESDPDDLLYAADRGLLPPADEIRIRNFLSGTDQEEPSGEVVQEDPEEMADLLAILNGSVGEIIARVDRREDLTEHEVNLLIEAENANEKPRKGVLDHLNSIDFEEEEEEESEEEDDS